MEGGGFSAGSSWRCRRLEAKSIGGCVGGGGREGRGEGGRERERGGRKEREGRKEGGREKQKELGYVIWTLQGREGREGGRGRKREGGREGEVCMPMYSQSGGVISSLNALRRFLHSVQNSIMACVLRTNSSSSASDELSVASIKLEVCLMRSTVCQLSGICTLEMTSISFKVDISVF